ncbi:diguanylate cyclase [Dyella sp.]|uniref:GGDEF domain-containing protein n=1 Tax=Dyella sp. TaxID=1869338 RepID=UPI003F817A65
MLAGCFLALLMLCHRAVAGDGDGPAGGFDRLADQLERGELVITTHDDALRLLDRLKGQIPSGDSRRELRYRYMFCILGMDGDPAAGVAYADRGIADAQRVGYTAAEVNFHFCRGANQESLTTARDALPDYNAGIDLARHAENTRLVADGLTWRGAVQSLLGEHALALVDFLEAQKFYDSAGEPIESEQNLFNVAVAYRRLGERSEARDYLDRLMKIGKERKDLPQQAAAHMQLGFLDSETGPDHLVAAREHFLAALQIARATGSHVSQGSAHMGLAQVFNQLGEYRGALDELAAARAEFVTTRDRSDRDMLALQEGEAHAGLGDHAQAISDFNRSEAFLRKSGNLRYLSELLEQRSHSYEALGKTALALADLQRMVKVHESLDRKAQSFTTTLMSYQFDTARKEQENRRLEADRQLREEQLAALERVRRWQRAALALGGILIVLLLWQAQRQLRRSRRLHRMAMTDPLTGIANRRRIEDLGRSMFAEAIAKNEPMALVVLDVDHFKQVNDAFGHQIGDKVLTRIVGACQGILRKADCIGRMGGEEFIVLLPGADCDEARQVAERLRKCVQATRLDDLAADLKVSISLGVGSRRPEDDLLESLVRRADRALYRAKDFGRNRVEVDLLMEGVCRAPE